MAETIKYMEGDYVEENGIARKLTSHNIHYLANYKDMKSGKPRWLPIPLIGDWMTKLGFVWRENINRWTIDRAKKSF